MSIESVMLSNHLILCCPLLLLPSIFPNIRVFSSESAFHFMRPECWSLSFSIRDIRLAFKELSPSVSHINLTQQSCEVNAVMLYV